MAAAEGTSRIREGVHRESERAALLAALAKRSPFDRLEREDLEWMIGRLRPARYAAGAVLLDQAAEPDRLYVVRAGMLRVEAVGEVGADRRVLSELAEGDCFPLEALHERRAMLTTLRAAVDTRCHELSREDFRALQARSPAFRAFCERRSRRLLERLQAILQAQRLSFDPLLLPADRLETLLRELGSAVRRAADVPALARAAGGVRQLARAAIADGVGAARLARLVSALNDRIAARAVDLELRQAERAGLHLCWLALGSEGRLEQTLCTEQDNGLVFDPGPGGDPEEIRALLLPMARRANAALAACGLPLCRGGVMAGNPAWCLSVEEWRARLGTWLREAPPDSLRGASIGLDLRPVQGDGALAGGLREWLAQAAPRSRRFLAQLARIARRRRAPLGILRDFAVDSGGESPGTIDLQGSGTALFVESARILGLATGSTAATTEERLRQGGERMGADAGDAAAWVEAFYFVQALRLRRQAELDGAGQPMHDRVDPRALNPLDRRLLREALRQASRLQERVARAWGPEAAGA